MTSVKAIKLRPNLVFRARPNGVAGQALEKERWPFSTSCAAAFCNIAKLAVAAINAATARKVHVIPCILFDYEPRGWCGRMRADVCRSGLKEASLAKPVNGARHGRPLPHACSVAPQSVDCSCAACSGWL